MPDSQNDLDFGHYRIQRLLGRGGMGEVYLARDADLERDVAIKFVSSDKVQNSAARTRLLREAQAAAGLDHPCICPVHEAGVTDDGRAYIVMPFIDGTPLADLTSRGPMPPREALKLCSQIADALATAHRHGIVHRDLKPGNVMMTSSGRPRLLDFGIAQTSLVPHAVAEATTVTAGPVTSGGLVGTPAYMSPEQVQHRQVDGRSDLFALGVVLYECLTGTRAFDGPTPYEAVANVLRLDPPPPSSRVPGLDGRYDALCARLMAKDPNDRFQSAEEVVGAIRVVLPDTGRITETGTQPIPPVPPHPIRRWARAAALLGIACAVAFGVWRFTQGTGLPSVPPDADQWYRRGTEALRDGAFQSARIALQRAVDLFPQHALAYARLAEADAELDDERSAQTHLLRLSSLVPDESQLSTDDQLRVRAVRETLLRNVDNAVKALQELVNRHPKDAGAWVDLGRAQEAAGLRDAARDSYNQAISTDAEYAAGYLQKGSVEAASLNVPKALEAFARADQLYQTGSNLEGETEVLLRRGTLLDGSNEGAKARGDIDRAVSLATTAKSLSQQVRARLILSSIMATAGQLSDAMQTANSAVSDATSAGLDVVAADGLVGLSAVLANLERYSESESAARQAVQLAESHDAKRTVARARLQLAESLRLQGKTTEAVTLVDSALPFIRSGQYRRLEMFGLLIEARSQRTLGHLDQARQMSAGVLTLAEKVNDEGQVALAASDLAGVNTVLGRYPEALRLRQRAEAIYKRQGDQSALPYTLANRADLDLRLGRAGDADAALSELEAGIAHGLQAYAGRARRVASLRAFQAAAALRCADALRFAAEAKPDPEPADSTSLLATGIQSYCRARLRQPAIGASAAKSGVDPAQLADRQYWLAAAALLDGDSRAALLTAQDGLTQLQNIPNNEVRWRLAAVALAAARTLGDQDLSGRMQQTSHDAFEAIRASWPDDFSMYESRADLVDLRKRTAMAR
jgi:serine/threonine protein kinase/predicted Zn-dependent protease